MEATIEASELVEVINNGEASITGVRAKFSLIFASREPNVLAAEIVEDLKVALGQFREIAGDLGGGECKTGAE